MEKLFSGFALLQVLLFVLLELGIGKRIIKDDLIVKLTKSLACI